VDSVTDHPSYRLSFSYPQGWLQLPVLDNAKAWERDKALESWAEQHARTMLGQRASGDTVRQRAAELVRLTVGSRGRQAMYGLAFYPPGAPGLLAILDAKRVVPDREFPELTFGALHELYAERTPQTVGDLETSEVELPSGPALRVRGKSLDEPDEQEQGIVMERVIHAIRPPYQPDAVVASMTWTALELGDKLAEMADAIARTIRVTPA
jgi:hypothetical protein